MLKHLTVKQHLEMAEKQWLMVAEKGISKHEALSEMLEFDVENVITYNHMNLRPSHNCYLCEVFNQAIQPTGCSLCPLVGYDLNCEDRDLPYRDYIDDYDAYGTINTDAAMEIVELIREGKKRFNY